MGATPRSQRSASSRASMSGMPAPAHQRRSSAKRRSCSSTGWIFGFVQQIVGSKPSSTSRLHRLERARRTTGMQEQAVHSASPSADGRLETCPGASTAQVHFGTSGARGGCPKFYTCPQSGHLPIRLTLGVEAHAPIRVHAKGNGGIEMNLFGIRPIARAAREVQHGSEDPSTTTAVRTRRRRARAKP